MEIKEIKIEKKNLQNGQEYTKQGGDVGIRWRAGVYVDGQWYNTTFWNEKQKERFAKLREGDRETFVFYTTTNDDGRTFQNFRFPTKEDHLEIRLIRLEKFANLVLENQPELKADFQRILS